MKNNILSLSIGNTVAQIISFVIIIITAKIFTQSDFGDLAVVVGMAGILRVIITLRYETLIVPSITKEESKKKTLLCLLLALSITCFTVLINFLLSIFFDIDSILISSIIALSLAIQLIAENFLNKSKRYNKIIFLKISQSLFIGVFAIIFGISSVNSGLIYGQLLGLCLSSFFAILFIKNVFKYFKDISLKNFLKNNIKTPKFLVPASFIEAINEQGTVILIAFLFLSDFAGYFSLSWRMAVVPITVISAAFSLIYFEKLSSLYNSESILTNVLISIWKKLFIFSMIFGVLIYFFIDEFVLLVLGNDWAKSADIISIIIFLIMARFISSPTSNIFIILKKLHINLIFSIFNLFVRFSSLIIGFYLSNVFLGIKIWVAGEIILIAIYNYYAYMKCHQHEKIIL